jgi:hypothetical protein
LTGSFYACNKYFEVYLKKIFLSIVIAFSFWTCEDKTQLTQELDTIVVSPVRSILQLGQTVQFNALAIDKSNSSMDIPVTWSTTNDQIATITKEGLVTAVGQGEANIYGQRGIIFRGWQNTSEHVAARFK